MPADKGLRSDDKQRLSPIRPDSREGEPKPSVNPSQSGPWTLSLHHRQLLPKSQILQSQFFKVRRENKKTKG